jgi:hypothetical protein
MDCVRMKTFRELISWELEQEKNQGRSVPNSMAESGEKLSSSLIRKYRYLNAARLQAGAQPGVRPA